MKRRLAVLLLLTACGSPPPVARPLVPEAQIPHLLDDWHDAAARADEQRYFSYFAPSAIFIGTDPAERWTLPQFRAYAHPYFAKGKAWTMRSWRREIAFRGDVAWFDEDLISEGLGEVRGTGVLVREAGSATWKIVQYSLSVPIPNEKFKDVRTLIESRPTSPR